MRKKKRDRYLYIEKGGERRCKNKAKSSAEGGGTELEDVAVKASRMLKKR